jgi:Tfp pilus assembly protein PilO
MKGSDKAIILGVVFALVLAGFYIKVLSPKREEASKLSKEITKLQADIDVQEQNAAYGEDARQRFPTYYGRMVVLGKAVPAQADTASLLVEINSISGKADVKFDGIQLSQASGATAGAGSTTAAPAPATPPAPAGSATPAPTSGSGTSTTPSTSGSSGTGSAAPASATTGLTPATEASAASVPLGSTVGPAGLHTLPYSLSFTGTFFDVADFFSGLDSLNDLRDGGTMVAADGRLMTVDGFSLESVDGSPVLDVGLAITTYVAPTGEGLTAGATPSGPAPAVTQPQTQPVSAGVTP